RLVDVYIPEKRSNQGKTFGFVRYLEVKNAFALERDLNQTDDNFPPLRSRQEEPIGNSSLLSSTSKVIELDGVINCSIDGNERARLHELVIQNSSSLMREPITVGREENT
ncbi:hypothetical protein Ancab_020657, partial [Ancistrocladus abbreviatus]